MSSKCNFSCWRPKTSRSKNTHLWGIQHSTTWSEIVKKGGDEISFNNYIFANFYGFYDSDQMTVSHISVSYVLWPVAHLHIHTPFAFYRDTSEVLLAAMTPPSLTLSGLVSVGAGGGWSQMMRRQLKIKFYQQLPVSIFLCIMVTLSQIQQLIYTPVLIWGIHSCSSQHHTSINVVYFTIKM